MNLVILCILILFRMENDWFALPESSWQCPLKVSTPGLWMCYHSESNHCLDRLRFTIFTLYCAPSQSTYCVLGITMGEYGRRSGAMTKHVGSSCSKCSCTLALCGQLSTRAFNLVINAQLSYTPRMFIELIRWGWQTQIMPKYHLT